MTLYTITDQCLKSDYHGAGNAWAAIRDGQVVALRYMDEYRPLGHDYELPAWIRAVMDSATGLDEHNLPRCHSSKAFSAMAAAAQACDDCPKPPRRARYRPSELLMMARAALFARHRVSFAAYRDSCYKELAQLGDVVSGTCSCTEFYDQKNRESERRQQP